MVQNFVIKIQTKGLCDIVDITDDVIKAIHKSKIHEGIALVFCPSSTSGITTIDFEPGCIHDLSVYLESAIPMDAEYRHNLKWQESNGFAHLRSAIIPASYSFPVIKGEPVLSAWQQIVFVDFDNKVRYRNIMLMLNGE